MKRHLFLERYLAGEHVTVWRELRDLGDKVLDEPLRSEALEVCREIVRRVRFNLRTLHARLVDLAYEFEEPSNALVDADPAAAAEVDVLEQMLGAFPLIARIWYQTFASVNFSQAEHQRVYRGGIRPRAESGILGLGSHPVLVFQSLKACRAQLQLMAAQQEEHIRQMEECGWEELAEASYTGKFLPLGGWASNCEPKGFRLPCFGIDGVICNDGGGDVYFVDKLRFAFRWGGFPFWQWSFKRRDSYSPGEYRPEFKKLLPLLKEGLLDL